MIDLEKRRAALPAKLAEMNRERRLNPPLVRKERELKMTDPCAECGAKPKRRHCKDCGRRRWELDCKHWAVAMEIDLSSDGSGDYTCEDCEIARDRKRRGAS